MTWPTAAGSRFETNEPGVCPGKQGGKKMLSGYHSLQDATYQKCCFSNLRLREAYVCSTGKRYEMVSSVPAGTSVLATISLPTPPLPNDVEPPDVRPGRSPPPNVSQLGRQL